MRPSGLPKAREQLHRYLINDTSPMHDALMNTPGGELPTLARYLVGASLYWVAENMTALAVAAGSKLNSVLWSDRPAHAGLMAFDGDFGVFSFTGGLTDDVDVPISALAWAPEPDACRVWIMQSRARMAEFMPERAYFLTPQNMPPLIPLHSISLPVGLDAQAVAAIPLEWRTALTTLAAAWMLMEQPILTDRTTERPAKSTRRANARAQLPTPEVTVIDLRRRYVPQNRDPDAGDERRYKHRFVVSGHWRNQAWGPEHSLRRRQWVPSFVKGPDGAPLLVTEKVNVWRR